MEAQLFIQDQTVMSVPILFGVIHDVAINRAYTMVLSVRSGFDLSLLGRDVVFRSHHICLPGRIQQVIQNSGHDTLYISCPLQYDREQRCAIWEKSTAEVVVKQLLQSLPIAVRWHGPAVQVAEFIQYREMTLQCLNRFVNHYHLYYRLNQEQENGVLEIGTQLPGQKIALHQSDFLQRPIYKEQSILKVKMRSCQPLDELVFHEIEHLSLRKLNIKITSLCYYFNHLSHVEIRAGSHTFNSSTSSAPSNFLAKVLDGPNQQGQYQLSYNAFPDAKLTRSRLFPANTVDEKFDVKLEASSPVLCARLETAHIILGEIDTKNTALLDVTMQKDSAIMFRDRARSITLKAGESQLIMQNESPNLVLKSQGTFTIESHQSIQLKGESLYLASKQSLMQKCNHTMLTTKKYTIYAGQHIANYSENLSQAIRKNHHVITKKGILQSQSFHISFERFNLISKKRIHCEGERATFRSRKKIRFQCGASMIELTEKGIKVQAKVIKFSGRRMIVKTSHFLSDSHQ